MSPLSSGLNLDLEALSGICGSISIACWVVVFSPQIIENFRRSSADGLSLLFIVVWLLGDVFNILGAVLQGVLPTMTILAVYYTVADIVLLGQCFYYRGFTLSDAPIDKSSSVGDEEAIDDGPPTEASRLLPPDSAARSPSRPRISDADRPSRGSFSSIHSRLSNNVDATHLSPATPFLPPPKPTAINPSAPQPKPRSNLSAFIFNTTALILVCAAGILGWYLSSRSSHHQQQPPHHHPHPTITTSSPLHFETWGQIFGYLCAALYLGSRIPQLLLNHTRKSTEGVSILFFLFACVGNLTYVLSILAHEPECAHLQLLQSAGAGACGPGEWNDQYARYILVNTSWLVGSAGTLVLDGMIFAQFWLYRKGGGGA